MKKILIVDDSNFNGELLIDIISEKYEVMYIDNGRDALLYMSEHIDELYMLLLDIVMPDIDGFDVLSVMNKNGWINKLPVVMISTEVTPTYINHAYDLGAMDYLARPFEPSAIFRRMDNAIKKFNSTPTEIKSEESDMVEVLSNLVEFRNGETGLHLLHIKVITSILLKRYCYLDDKVSFSDEFIELVSNASALHDLGKISIPYEILHKPGRLTKEEFEIVKKHSLYGAEMIANSPNYKTSKLLQLAYEIARWHHEKIDGNGYPDGLKGDEIPLYVQAVSIADCFDALTTERCYKKAIEPEKAIKMLINGECGQFSPIMIKCLIDSKEELIALADLQSPIPTKEESQSIAELQNITGKNKYFTSKIKLQLDIDRLKNKYLYDGKNQCVFEYNFNELTLSFSRFNLNAIVKYDDSTISMIKKQIIAYLSLDEIEKGERIKRITLSIEDQTFDYTLHLTLVDNDDVKIVVGKIYD